MIAFKLDNESGIFVVYNNDILLGQIYNDEDTVYFNPTKDSKNLTVYEMTVITDKMTKILNKVS